MITVITLRGKRSTEKNRIKEVHKFKCLKEVVRFAELHKQEIKNKEFCIHCISFDDHKGTGAPYMKPFRR